MSFWKTCCCQCEDAGKFVYAAKSMGGFISNSYLILPDIVKRLYRKVNAVNTRDLYWLNGGVYEYWHTATHTIEIELHPILPAIIMHAIVTGSDSGLLYEATLDESTGLYDVYFRDSGDYHEIFDPGDTSAFPDLFPATFSGAIQKVNSASETANASEWTQYEGEQITQKMSSVVTFSELIDATSITGEVAAMMATVPLSPMSTPNLISLAYDLTYGSGFPVVATTSTISTSDTACDPAEDRDQTFTPAAMITSFYHSSTGNTDGEFYPEDYEFWIGAPYYAISFGLSAPTTTSSSANGKKGLLTRTTTDDWVLLRPYDPDTEEYGIAVCVGEDVTKCRRFYYPADSDDGGSGPQDVNLTIPYNGIIYREIPIDLGCTTTGLLDFTNTCP